MNLTQSVAPVLAVLLSSCASSTAVLPASSSKSGFDGAVFSGETVALETPTLGAESFRVFQQGATGFVSLQAVRSGAEEIAQGFCDRKGKSMRGISETDAKPPYILGNFPRVELVFECADKPKDASAKSDVGKYEKLAALKKLLDNGTLTQQEFESEKAKLLASP